MIWFSVILLLDIVPFAVQNPILPLPPLYWSRLRRGVLPRERPEARTLSSALVAHSHDNGVAYAVARHTREVPSIAGQETVAVSSALGESVHGARVSLIQSSTCCNLPRAATPS